MEKGLYGSVCIAATEQKKQSNFAEQLKLLQNNAEVAGQTSSENGEADEKKEYDDIFGDPNLFKNFGGFDAKEEEEQETSD